METANLIDKLSSRLSPAPRHALETTLRLADEKGLTLYLVGGPVRDLLLGGASLDLDLALEADARELAQRAAELLGARCVTHAAFLTATIKGEGFLLDLATARAETYDRPGALPRVRPASIREDALRRDFTINAMALPLGGAQRGELLDPCGGRTDLEAALLRVLHENSFVDDATRILRAARYEARFGFRLEERTLARLRRDAGYLEAISGARIRQELARIFHEPEPERALLRLEELGALAAVHPALSFDGGKARAFARLRGLAPDAVSAVCWPLLAWCLGDSQAAALAGRLALTRAQSEAARAMPRLCRLQVALGEPAIKPSEVVDALSPYPPAAVWALAAATESETVRQRCVTYLKRWRYVKPVLDGHALLTLAVPPGPAVGDVLRRLKVAKLDGDVRSRKDEERLVRSLLVSSTPKPKARLQPDE